MKDKNKIGIYLSSFGVVIGLFLVIFQLFTPEPMTTGIVILFANLTLLFVNLSSYKSRKKEQNN